MAQNLALEMARERLADSRAKRASLPEEEQGNSLRTDPDGKGIRHPDIPACAARNYGGFPSGIMDI